MALVIICVAVPSAHGQEVADSLQKVLGPEEFKEYRAQRLSVVIKTRTERTLDITGVRYYGIFEGAVRQDIQVEGSGSTFKSWMPYKGFERITEPRFFKLAGYPKQAQEAKDFHMTARRPIWATAAGVTLSGLSAAAFTVGGIGLLSSQATGGGPSDQGLFLSGLAGIAASIAILSVKEEAYDPGPPMWAPASQVHGIAGEYNRQLYKELKGLRTTSAENP